MSERTLWEDRYDTPEMIHGTEPSEFLRENVELIPKHGLALDVAGGEGRNSLMLAELGCEVILLDLSVRALQKCKRLARERGVSVACAAVDLSSFLLPPDRFDLIICFNYLRRDLIPTMKAGLRRGGVLIYETLATAHLRWKPGFNPDFLLRPGELLYLFGGLRLLKYREADLRIGERVRSVASVISKRE
ncbi:MAG TPA: class I SAM-dependent methyltransferase [Blastocatellia bacterium]|nr:class I SAM-dependent methyltransferase [Blastocatellia bacterium]